VILTCGVGFTTTETLNGAPRQEPKLIGPIGVTIYVTEVGVVLVDVNV
jgi:hypothetical protein